MHPLARWVGAIVLGLIVAFAVTFGIELVNSQIFPLPPGTDYRDASAMRAAMAALPERALILVLVGWFAAAVAGSWVAVRVAQGDRKPAWVLGALLMIAAVANMRLFPHPIWFWVIGIVLYPVAIMVGVGLGTKKVRA
jgi:hypothetical protein